MLDRIEKLVTMFERGHISRRDLIRAVAVAAAAPAALAAGAEAQRADGPEPVFRGRIVNHVTLNVTDLERSRAFYQGLVGATILVNNAPHWYDMRIGDSMVDVAAAKEPRIGHFSVGVEPWVGPERALEAIQKRFPQSEPRIQQNPVLGRPEAKISGPGANAKEIRAIFLKDPDGLVVQINHPRYQLI